VRSDWNQIPAFKRSRSASRWRAASAKQSQRLVPVPMRLPIIGGLAQLTDNGQATRLKPSSASVAIGTPLV
jgi:hypothetical protein